MNFGINRIKKSFLLKLYLAIISVIVGDVLFYQNDLYNGYIGFYLLMLLVLMLLTRRAILHDRRALLATSTAGIFAGIMIFNANFMAWTLFWGAAGMATLFPAVAHFDDGSRWGQRLLLHGLRSPVAPFLDLYRITTLGSQKKAYSAASRLVFSLLVILVGICVVTLLLFARADDVLVRDMSNLFYVDFRRFSPIRVLLWLALLAMVWSLLRPKPTQEILWTFERNRRGASGASVASVIISLGVMNLLLAAKNVSDVGYLIGLTRRPVDLTLAEFAHAGAYPLLGVSFLTAIFSLVMLRPGSRTAEVRAIRLMVIFWIVQTVILAATSALRILDYVQAYSLTSLRVAALALVLLITLSLGSICWYLLQGRSGGWIININVAGAAVFLSIMSVVDLGALSAWWNIGHAREVTGRGAPLDLCYLEELGSSALLPLIALERTSSLPESRRIRVQSVRIATMGKLDREISAGGWTLLGQHRLWKAQRAVASLPSLPALYVLPLHPSCDGSPTITVQAQGRLEKDRAVSKEPITPDQSSFHVRRLGLMMEGPTLMITDQAILVDGGPFT